MRSMWTWSERHVGLSRQKGSSGWRKKKTETFPTRISCMDGSRISYPKNLCRRRGITSDKLPSQRPLPPVLFISTGNPSVFSSWTYQLGSYLIHGRFVSETPPPCSRGVFCTGRRPWILTLMSVLELFSEDPMGPLGMSVTVNRNILCLPLFYVCDSSSRLLLPPSLNTLRRCSVPWGLDGPRSSLLLASGHLGSLPRAGPLWN